MSSNVNLTITNTTAPTIANGGELIELSWTVTNTGIAPISGFWADQVYFSKNKVLDNRDTFLASVILDNDESLQPNESYTITQTVSLPDKILGNGYFLFASDRWNFLEETNETDNTIAVKTTINSPNINLTVTNATVPAIITAEEEGEISWTVTNIGTTTAFNSWFDYVYFSADEVFDESDIYSTLATAWSGSYVDSLAPNESYTVTANVDLPREALDSNYILFVTDRNNTQKETDETDNTLAVPLTITVPDVNLVVSNVTAPTTAIAGEAVEVSWTVTNTGTATTSKSWYDIVYFSTDEVFDPFEDTFLTSIFLDEDDYSLGSNENYTQTEEMYFPEETVGSGYILFINDSSNDQLETDETDNTVVVPIAITTSDANLTLTNPTAPATARKGETIEISWTVTNTGTTTASSDQWTDYAYFSTDQVLDNSDIYLTSETLGGNGSFYSLEPNESYTITKDVFLLPNQQFGSGYILFASDRSNRVPETNESDNTLAVLITIAPPDINLVITDATVPPTANSGESVEISWTVTNTGTTSTFGYWSSAVYYSTDQVLDNSDIYLTDYYPPNLAANESSTVSRNIDVPEQVVSSGYFLFIADRFNSQQETDETDNTLAVPISINPPDVNLVVTNGTAPSLAISGDQIQVSWTVTNTGTTATSNYWYDTVIFSPDEVLNDNDFYLTTSWLDFSNDPLAPNESYTRFVSVDLPDEVAGSGYILFVSDRGNQQQETDETDNILAVPISLTSVGNIITGTNYPDYLVGTAGDDTITGSLGADTIEGNGGQDTFVYTSTRDRIDTITDFEADDRIDLSQIFANANYGQTDRFASYVQLVQAGSNTQVQINMLGDSGSTFRNLVILEYVQVTELSESNFLV